MAIKISQLANLTSVSDGILFPIVDTTGVYTSKKANASIIKTYIQSDFGNAAFSNDYTDLDNLPTIPTHTGNLTNDSGFITSAYITWANVASKPTFANVATTGAYSDLSGTPTLANVATTGDYDDLINTPTLANVATSGSYNDLSDVPGNVATNISNVTIDGDLVPTANLAYNLGSSDNRFRDLYLSGNTTIGNATITSNAGAVSITTLEVTAVTLNLGATITDQDDGTGINTAFVSGSVGGAAALSAVAPNVALFNTVGVYEDYANVVITNDSDTVYTWQFANTGTLSWPDNTVQSSAYTATFANATPSSASATGTKGDIQYDASYVYICVATDTWIRAAREAW